MAGGLLCSCRPLLHAVQLVHGVALEGCTRGGYTPDTVYLCPRTRYLVLGLGIPRPRLVSLGLSIRSIR